MTCADAERLLSLQLDGELPPDRRSPLEDHLSGCAPCRAALDAWARAGLSAMDALRSSIPDQPVRPGTGRSRRARLPRRRPSRTPDARPWIAGAAAALVLIGLLVLASRKPPAPPRPAPAPQIVREQTPAPEPPPAPPSPPPPLTKEPGSFVSPPSAPRTEEPRPPAPEPPRPEPPPPAPRPPDPAPPPPSRPAVARVEQVEGEASVVAGRELLGGDGVSTGAGRAVLVFPDGTRIELAANTRVASVSDADGKRVRLEAGRLTTAAAPQPAGRPLVIATPHAEARVLGTLFDLRAEEAASRLDVREGRVRLTRLRDGRSLEVAAGHYAVAGAEADFAARRLPVDEIVLVARDGRFSGDEWRAVKDEEAGEGAALETLATANAIRVTTDADREKVNRWFTQGRSRSFVQFTFHADADRDYVLWVRGKCLAPAGPDRGHFDDVMAEVLTGRFVRRPADWYPYADTLCPIQGFGRQAGYWWSGGAHDLGRTQTPIVVRFHKTGLQAIRLHASEPPMRVDALWLSTTRLARPAPEDRAPVHLRR